MSSFIDLGEAHFNPFQCHLSKVLLIPRRFERCNLRMSTLGTRAYINTWTPCQTIWVVHRRRTSYDHAYPMILWYGLIGRIVYVASPAWNIRCLPCCGTYSESLLFFYWSKRQNENGIWRSVEHACRFKVVKLQFFYLTLNGCPLITTRFNMTRFGLHESKIPLATRRSVVSGFSLKHRIGDGGNWMGA